MNKHFQRLGTLCLLLLVTCWAKAQGDVTATWDFQNRIPASLSTVAYQGNTGYVESDVEGVSLYVDATNGKFNAKDRSSDVQVNKGTIVRVPVKSTRDVVTVTSYPGYHYYTLGGVEVTEDVTSCKASTADVTNGYVELVTTDNSYLYKIQVVFVSAVQEKELYSTDFTEWGDYETSAKEVETFVTWSTKYSHEQLTFTVFNTQIGASNFNTGKFPTWEGGMLMAAKSDNPYVVTSPLASITKVHFMHGATGSKRGWKLWAKGDGDDDWVLLSSSVANPAAGCDVDVAVNRTNCQLKFTNITNNQNAYLMQLDIYGNVDMSKTPALGSFKVNGVQYFAADICEEDAQGNMVATVEISKAEQMIGESNPLTDIVADNGEISSVTYTTTDSSTVASIVVAANGQEITYNINCVFKPDFTLTYYNIDGSVIGTQLVEKDAAIGAFVHTVADVTVPEGQAYRGWAVSAQGGRKYTTDDVVTSDLDLYALVTDIEVESTSARYTFDLRDQYFYDEDHEAFNATNGAFHDGTHGWTINAGGTIDLLVGGHAYIILELCRYGNSSTITLNDAAGNAVGSVSVPVGTDGQSRSFEYTGGAGTVTLNFSNGVYLHKVIVANVESAPIEKNAQGYYVVRAGDAGHLLTTLEIANANASATERTFIFVPDGTYDLGNTVLTPISGNNISLIGQSMDSTIIVNKPEVEGIGVTATILVTGENTYMQDLTLKNAYDYYQPGFAGRAVCLQDKGKRTICKNVRMLSYQDTYYSNNASQYYFETSDIHGTVDFICGGGDVFFNRCTLTVEPRNADGSGECTLTAPSTIISSNKFGYVFSGCTIDSKAQKFNYGRAWNDNPRCAYINTTLLQPERLNANRWTFAGMGVPADKFVEYNTMDSEGNVISPESFVATFTKDSKQNTYETILTAEEAEEYAIDKVFTNWTPAELAAQTNVEGVTFDGTTLKWNAVEGATAYAIFNRGVFVEMTSGCSYVPASASDNDFCVRAANAMGGFGLCQDSASSINQTGADAAVVSTAYYTPQGVRVNASYRGVLIKVDTMADGRQVSTKLAK